MKDQRYVAEKTKKADQARREREEFLSELEQIRKGSAAATEEPLGE
jgi:hypothetical protein